MALCFLVFAIPCDIVAAAAALVGLLQGFAAAPPVRQVQGRHSTRRPSLLLLLLLLFLSTLFQASSCFGHACLLLSCCQQAALAGEDVGEQRLVLGFSSGQHPLQDAAECLNVLGVCRGALF